MTITEWVPTHKLNRLQELLKIHGGWFTWPASYGELDTRDTLYLTYKFDSMKKFNAFYQDWTCETTNIVEKTRKKTWLRTLKTFLSRLF